MRRFIFEDVGKVFLAWLYLRGRFLYNVITKSLLKRLTRLIDFRLLFLQHFIAYI